MFLALVLVWLVFPRLVSQRIITLYIALMDFNERQNTIYFSIWLVFQTKPFIDISAQNIDWMAYKVWVLWENT